MPARSPGRLRAVSTPHTLEPGQAGALADTLARAFRDNPLNRAVIGDDADRRLRANRAGMRATLATARGRCPVLAVTGPRGAISGGLVAMAPGRWPLPPPPILEQLRVVVGQGLTTARRWGEVFDALQVVHPIEPHWYLALLGVAPESQGCGQGAALVTHWLCDVDATGAPAYLETDRKELLAFYGRFGFEPIGSEALFGVTVHRLWRTARS